MEISVILAHPDQNSFNHAIARVCLDALKDLGHIVSFHDLYEEGFDPLLRLPEIPRTASLDGPTKKHCDEISSADGIIIVHPNWWGQPPAILKGWVDRVLRPGIAYEFMEGDTGEGVPRGLLKARCALVFNTSNTVSEREARVFGDPLDAMWKKCVFELCGVARTERRMFNVIVTSDLEQRKRWLSEVACLVRDSFRR
ncbi:MAG: NAD(P)H-dependent oxidoreductase [Candidatus Omnitrophica bacterium]|nr:NAD(P)H-dependent oxidoreductase [Candidatus Omnitrophota bacterium]MDD5488474.1 NAD(P)H-dependent oxidoreductase [Candidatus Omnitrophota bacterium]